MRPGEAQGKFATHRHFAKTMARENSVLGIQGANPCRRRHFAKAVPHENSVLGIQGGESLSTSTFAKTMPHENSVLGIHGGESLSTSTFCKGDATREQRSVHPRGRILVDVDILQRRCRTRIAIWASTRPNPCRRRHFAKAMSHESSVLGIQEAEFLSTSILCKGDVARE